MTPLQMREVLRLSVVEGSGLHESLVTWETQPVACDDVLVVLSNVTSSIAGKRRTDPQTSETTLDHFDLVQIRVEHHDASAAQDLVGKLRMWFSHDSTLLALYGSGLSVLEPPKSLTYAGYQHEDLWVDVGIFELHVHYLEKLVDPNLVIHPVQRVVASGTVNGAEFTATVDKV